MKPKCLRSRWSTLEQHRGSEGGKTKSGLISLFSPLLEARVFKVASLCFTWDWRHIQRKNTGEPLPASALLDREWGFLKLQCLYFLNLFCCLSSSCSLFSALSISTTDKHTLALLLQTHTTCRIVDFINVSSYDPVVYLSLRSKCYCPCRDLNAHIADHQWALIPEPLYHSGVCETEPLSLSKKLRDKNYWILSVMFPCARNVLAPTQHVIRSDFDFFLSYFIMFVLFLFCCFICLCVRVLICFFCVSTPPLLCLQLALSVSTHPSDLIPSCMPSPYTPTAPDCLTINYHCLNITVFD